MALTLWHCKDTRSFRPLWALEEMQISYKLELLPFPPRVFQKDYLEINPLGTIPFLRDGQTTLTESVAICQYLAERYAAEFTLVPDHPDYGAYLNWLHQSDATLTFPQALMLRYGPFADEAHKLPQVVQDYRNWALARMRWLDGHLSTKDWLAADRFTVADIAVGYALYLGRLTGLSGDYTMQTSAYLDRLMARPAFQRAQAMQADAPGWT